MGNTSIQWTDSVWNPTRGCSRVSEGCRNCYAERQAYRFSDYSEPFHGFAEYKNGHPSWTGNVELIESKLTEPLHWRKPRRIFVNSMSDLFHEALPDKAIDRVFAVMALCPQHTFQILTKRPNRMLAWTKLPRPREYQSDWWAWWRTQSLKCGGPQASTQWPLPNVWLGVSVEDQATADARIPLLLQTPAAIRFVSYEPALGPVDFEAIPFCLRDGHPAAADIMLDNPYAFQYIRHGTPGLNWLIAGGESGPGARPPAPEWFRSVRDQCIAAGVPFFYKQWGEWSPERPDGYHKVTGKRYSHETFARGKDGGKYNPLNPAPDDFPKMMFRVGKKAAGRLLDGQEWNQFPK